MKSKSLLIQFAFAITFFISIFEFAIFIGSYRSQKESLKQLRVGSKIKMNNINMDINFDQENKFVSVDSSSIEQVFMNLISNAIDGMENTHEKINSISSSISDNFLSISSKDNGPGIPAESSENIFNSFFTTKEEGKGTGLGLNIVKNIVESHNGTIQLNTNFMSGAEFLISLPLSS